MKMYSIHALWFFALFCCSIALTVNAVKDLRRIIEGTTLDTPLPFQVSLSMGCGGSLIGPRTVLSAAHCFDEQVGQTSYIGLKFGALNHRIFENFTHDIIVDRKNVIIHEDYIRQVIVNDIAIIKLPVEIAFNENIQPIMLPREDIDYAGRSAIVYGWGRNDTEKHIYEGKLKKLELTVLSHRECQAKNLERPILSSYICVDTIDKETPCQGDSGGPLVLQDKPNILIGIVSFGDRYCQNAVPPVFTRVSKYLNWIKKNAGINWRRY